MYLVFLKGLLYIILLYKRRVFFFQPIKDAFFMVLKVYVHENR